MVRRKVRQSCSGIDYFDLYPNMILSRLDDRPSISKLIALCLAGGRGCPLSVQLLSKRRSHCISTLSCSQRPWYLTMADAAAFFATKKKKKKTFKFNANNIDASTVEKRVHV